VAVTIHIPGPLRAFSGGAGRVEIPSNPATLREALEELWKRYPGIRDRVVNEEGQLREHINIFVGNENIRYSGDFATPLKPGAEISILPSVSGGVDVLSLRVYRSG
jgi:molybdopterin synthase sulfur carrier subunit